MAAIQVELQPVCEPVSLEQAKNYCRVLIDNDDDLISGLIVAARQACETFCARSFINKGYVQYLDAFPYFTDSMMSQQAYPPSYYSLPRYSTAMWNYSQMIKLFYSRLQSVTAIRYVGSQDGAWHTLQAGADVADQSKDFLIDTASEPPRIFPNADGNWPSVLYVPNAVEVHYVAGYNNDAAIAAALAAWKTSNTGWTPDQATDHEALLRQADVPQTIKTAILQMVSNWYENREAASPLTLKEIPTHLEFLLWSERVLDLAPTRG